MFISGYLPRAHFWSREQSRSILFTKHFEICQTLTQVLEIVSNKLFLFSSSASFSLKNTFIEVQSLYSSYL